MDDSFYEENLDESILARYEIIARFQEWWSEDEIRNILKDATICSPAFLPNMEAMAESGYGKQLDHKEYARILYEQVGEKFLQDKDMDKRYGFLTRIFRAVVKEDPSKEDEINDLMERTFLLSEIPEYSSDELFSYLRNNLKQNTKFLGKLIDIIHLPIVCAERIPKGRDWKSQLIEPLASVGALYDFQRDISRQIQRMLTEYSNESSRAMVALPTGSGKTRVVVESIIDWINNGKPGQPKKNYILWMVERKELCQQAFDTFRTMFLSKGKQDTSLDLLVYWGNKSKNLATNIRKQVKRENQEAKDDDDTLEVSAASRTTIIIASRGSLVSIVNKNEKLPEANRYLKKLAERLAIVVIDEAHSAMNETSTQVLHSLGFDFRAAARGGKPHPNDVRLLGLTATPFKNIKPDRDTRDEPGEGRILKDETEKLQSRFGNNFLWPDVNSSISRHHVNQPHAIIELQKYTTLGNDVLISGKRSFDQDGKIEDYYWQVKMIQQGGGSTYKYDTGKKNELKGDPAENVRLWKNNQTSQMNEEEEIWAGNDIFDEPGLYDVFLWVKDDDGLCNQIEDIRRIIVTEPETKGDQDNQIRMREILKNLKEQKVLASPKRWIISHDLSHLRVEFKSVVLQGVRRWQNELDDDSMRRIAADTVFNRKIILVIKKLIDEEKRKSILIFANTVDHAKLLSSMIRASVTENGKPVTAEFIYADTHVDERCKFIRQFRDQELRVLCNYDILTQGFDAPKVDAIVVARDTGSYVLHTQMIGRGLRGPRNGGTEECRIVDFSNKIREQQRMLSAEERLDAWRFHPELYDEDIEISDFELGFKKLDDMKWPDSTEVVYKAWKDGGTVSNGGVGKHEITNLLKLFTEQQEYQEWQPEFYEYLKQEDKRIDEDYQQAFLHPEDEPAITGLDLEGHVASPDKKSFDDLIDFIDNIMQMEAVYQPVMIKFLLTQSYYTASRRQIASELASADHSPGPKDYEKVSVYHVLTDHHIVNTEPGRTISEDLFTLNVKDLTERQKGILDGKLEIAITKFINRHGTQEKIVLPDNSEILFESNPKAIGRDNFSKCLQSKNEKLPKISRVQFTISQESGHCYIEDGVTSVQEKPSANGTKVNGQDITGQGKIKLENDDVIELSGIIEVTFQSTTKTDEKKKTEREELEEKYARETTPQVLKKAITEFKKGEFYHRDIIRQKLDLGFSGGIRSSVKNNIVVLFWNAPSDNVDQSDDGFAPNIYQDYFNAETGLYHYIGEGQIGDQTLDSGSGGNKRIVKAKEQGRTIHLFHQHNKKEQHEYLGQVKLVDITKERQPDAERNDREVLVFLLKPV